MRKSVKLLLLLISIGLLSTSSFSACPVGDITGDCRVDANDLGELAEQWLLWSGTADLDGQDGVRLPDFAMMAENWLIERKPIVINELLAGNTSVIQDPQEPGEYPDWFELYNPSDESVDLSGMYLTDDLADPTKHQIPAGVTIAAGQYLLFWADNEPAQGPTHTEFALSKTGESLALFDTDGVTLVDSVTFGNQEDNVSYGRYPDAVGSWVFFAPPSPGAANNGESVNFVGDVAFSHEHGFYDGPFDVTITCNTTDATIYYTLNGSKPDDSKVGQGTFLYSGPIAITGTTVLRAGAFESGFQPGNIATASYIFLDDAVAQPANPVMADGTVFPDDWTGVTLLPGEVLLSGEVPADYEMDTRITHDPVYSQTIKDDLLSLPTLSIVMDMDELFDLESGIYANPTADENGNTHHDPDPLDQAWERDASIEIIMPEGDEGIQVDARIQNIGGASAAPFYNKKRAFRFAFRDAYGAAKLKFPVFDDSNIEEFDHLMMRTGSADSFGQNKQRAQYTRDEWLRRTALDMGQIHPHGTSWHFYINGLYWGLANPLERPNSSQFCAAYFGGDPLDWDIIKRDYNAPTNYEYEGDPTQAAWNLAKSLAKQDLSNQANYEALADMVDVDALIDYVTVQYYGYNTDWPSNNWSVARLRQPGGKFRFLLWDCDATIGVSSFELYANQTGTGSPYGGEFPPDFDQACRANPEYRMLFADHIQRHFFNGGALDPERACERFLNINGEVERAIVGESARWGDQLTHVGDALVTPADWFIEQQHLLNDWFPNRTEILFNQFKACGLYPNIAAPKFFLNGKHQHGGQVNEGDSLTIVNPNTSGAIYYTLDGSDPRLTGGALNSAAVPFNIVSQDVTLVAENAEKRVFVPTAATSTAWRILPDFDDSTWNHGTYISGKSGGVGYETVTAYKPYISYDVQSHMLVKNTTCYVRIPFTVDAAELAQLYYMELNMRYDDGFIAYINGVKVAERNAPSVPGWDSCATGWHSTASFVAFDVSDAIGSLVPGDNILAIHGMVKTDSDDRFLVSAVLKARIPISQDNIQLSKSSVLKSRIRDSGQWSALSEATFGYGPVKDNLRITELMYHPADPPLGDPNEEFIELMNVGDETIDLSFVSFTKGIDFTFGDPSTCFSTLVLDEDFSGGDGGFTYQDDAFGTSNPSKASGVYTSTEGYSGGGLKATLGPGPFTGAASGAWTRSFSADAPVSVDVRYRMTTNSSYTADEYSEAILEVDGVRYGNSTDNSLVHRAGVAAGMVRITEVNTSTSLKYVEIQNVGPSVVDTTGWVVVVKNSSQTSINAFHQTFWQLPTTIAANQILYRTNSTSDNYWGENISLANTRGWAMIVDAQGNIVDFMVWGYNQSSIATLNISVNGHNITVGSAWSGDGISAGITRMGRYGNSDNNVESDWQSQSATKGTQHPNLITPFTGLVGIPFDSGWLRQQFSISLTGNAHTIKFGAYCTSTAGNGQTQVFFDDVIITLQTTPLNPGEYAVLVKDMAAFTSRYGTGINVLGQYSGSLSNSGERIKLVDAAGQEVLDFNYKDSWQKHTDGEGFSLTVIDPNSPDVDSWDWESGWGGSTYIGGTPGAGDPGPKLGDVVINEVLAHSDGYPNDWIELHNTTDSPIDIGGWYLSDDEAEPRKYRIHDDTIIDANGYELFTQNEHFGNAGDPCSIIQFALSENGEAVYLTSSLGTELTGYREREDFGASENGVSFGYYEKSTGTHNFVPMSQNTPGTSYEGAPNAYPRVGPIVISEIMYAPKSGDQAEEYVELYNITPDDVSLYDFTQNAAWKFAEGVDYTFSPSTVIPGYSYLIVVKDVNAFDACYTVPAGTQVVGPYEGLLNNDSDKVELSKPGDLVGSLRYYIRVDRVNYSDGDHGSDFIGPDPWPDCAASTGYCLNRKVLANYGNDPENWIGMKPTPGRRGAILINEFMADNASVAEDPEEPGEYPDWIELYNADGAVIELGGMYLTNNPANPTMWQIPAGTSIEPYDYLLLWADGDDFQGPLHTNFQLDAPGGYVGLFDVDGATVMDEIEYASQNTDKSFGRFPEGADNWITFTAPTPGAASNLGLISRWRLDGNAADSQGANDGTTQGDPDWTAGRLEGGLALDGSDDYILIGDKPDLDFGAADSFSISAWMKSSVNQGIIASKIRASDGQFMEGYFFAMLSGRAALSIWDSNGAIVDIYGATFLNDNAWHHIAATRDTAAGQLHLYVDGLADAQPVQDTTTASLETTDPFYIGRWSMQSAYFAGVIDDVRVYGRALTEVEIAHMANP